MRKALIAISLLAAIAFSPAEAARVENLENLPVPERTDGTGFTLDEVQALIIQGCARRQWKPEVEGDSVMAATLKSSLRV